MDRTTGLRITYVFEDGERSDLALGRIDALGVMTLDRLAPGQEARVAELVAELNGAEQVFLRGGATEEGAVLGTLVKRAVPRGAPGFLAALVETARRFHGVDLQFDAADLQGLGVPDLRVPDLAPDPEVAANLTLDLDAEEGPGVG